jgi:hypothetical protein
MHSANCTAYPTKRVISLCISGVGNKIFSLVGGLYWAEKLGYDFNFFWEPDSECMCLYDELFQTMTQNYLPYNTLHNFKIEDIVVAGGTTKSSFVASILDEWNRHKSTPRKLKKLCLINSNKWLDTYDISKQLDLVKQHNILIYHDSKLPSYIPENTILELLAKFKFTQNITDTSNAFIKANNINKDTKGIMIRKHVGVDRADLLDIDEDYYLNIVKDTPSTQYFIMSDFYDIEQKFLQLSNVVCYPKRSYVSWSNNLQCWWRDRESVVDALISLIILSHTDIVKTISNSTFMDLCFLLSKLNRYEKQ